MEELADKLTTVREHLRAAALTGVRLRGVDWFAWISAGGSSAVLLASEVGVAEVLVTADDAWVLTDAIEAERLAHEELPPGLPVWSHPWAHPRLREEFVAQRCGAGPVASDRPVGDERPLPAGLLAARWTLRASELDRYRSLGRDAAAAITDALLAARPTWTGHALAGAAAEALWSRAIDPALVLVGDARRLPLYRHPTPRGEAIGARVMLVCCARRHGLYANLTRFLYFRTPDEDELRAHRSVAEVEADALDATRPGATLGALYDAFVAAYARHGHPGAEASHHQGGPCGYLSREAIARPGDDTPLVAGGAVAWNPSLPGAKIEDTALVTGAGLEILTEDPAWPSVQVRGRRRPDLLLR